MSTYSLQELLPLALIVLVGVLAWPRMRSHRWIVPLLCRSGQLLLTLALTLASSAIAFPDVFEEAMSKARNVMQMVSLSDLSFPTSTLIGVGSVLLLILYAPLAAWREALQVLFKKDEIAVNGPKPRATKTSSNRTSTLRPRPREELQALVERMKQTSAK